MKRLNVLLGVLALILVWALVPVHGQTLAAQIQQFWNTLRTGGYAYTTLHLNAGSYANWGTTLGVNGYGIRDSAGTMQVKNSGGSWSSLPVFPGTPYVAGDIFYATNTTTIGRLADVAVGQVLASGGIGVAPAYTATPLVSSLTAKAPSNSYSPFIGQASNGTTRFQMLVGGTGNGNFYIFDGSGNVVTTLGASDKVYFGNAAADAAGLFDIQRGAGIFELNPRYQASAFAALYSLTSYGIKLVTSDGMVDTLLATFNADQTTAFAGATTVPSLVFTTGTQSLIADAADVLWLRRTTNAQDFRIANTYTSGTSSEFLRLYWTGNTALVVTDKGSGGGSARAIDFGTLGAAAANIITNGNVVWNFTSGGIFQANTDNTLDIGQAASNRPRTGYFGTSLVTPTVNATTAFQVNATPITSGTTHLSAGSGMAVANVGANSCGTSTATIAGNNNAFIVTVGATAGTQCRVAFTVTATTGWVCAANDDTTTVAVRTTPVDTTHLDLIGTFTAGDTVSAVCFPR